jgi:hypothetical protein
MKDELSSLISIAGTQFLPIIGECRLLLKTVLTTLSISLNKDIGCGVQLISFMNFSFLFCYSFTIIDSNNMPLLKV